MPAVYRLEFAAGRWRVIEGPGFWDGRAQRERGAERKHL